MLTKLCIELVERRRPIRIRLIRGDSLGIKRLRLLDAIPPQQGISDETGPCQANHNEEQVSRPHGKSPIVVETSSPTRWYKESTAGGTTGDFTLARRRWFHCPRPADDDAGFFISTRKPFPAIALRAAARC